MRIVSLVPSLTETLWALGVGPHVVGVTHFCVRPEEARDRAARVGGTKNPKIPQILDLKPDLVAVNVEENRLEDVRQLQDAGVAVHVTDVRRVDDVTPMIHALAQATGASTRRAEALALQIDAAIDAAHAIAPDPPLPVFVPIWREPWMTFNRDTYAHSVLEAAGAENRFAPWPERYPEVEARDLAEAGARYALLPSEPYAFAEKHRAEVAGLLAVDAARVRLLDGEALTWWGARTAEGVLTVARTVAGLEGGFA